MYSKIIFVFMLGTLIGASKAQEKLVNFLEIAEYQCEGKDATNYTSVCTFQTDSTCSKAEEGSSGYLIACASDGKKSVISLTLLSESNYPAGAYYQRESLYLAQGGNIGGKFIYIKEINLSEAYLKKCSSVLGQSFVSSQSHVMLIADKLDLNIFLSPNGAFEPFRKSASTSCQGKATTF